MTTQVYDWPSEWYRFATAKFKLRSRNQTSTSPWLGASNVYGPHAQLWCAEVMIERVEDPMRQEIEGFIARLEGQAGLLRFYDVTRPAPWYNRHIAPTREAFSDGKYFDDGTGFLSGLLPPRGFVSIAANRGDKNLVIGGLTASLSNALTRGDFLQIAPGGDPGAMPNLYQIVRGSSTNSAGEAGVEVRPRLRKGVAAGDQVILENPSSVFRLSDDDDGELEISPPVFGSGGFKLVEALDQVA